MDNFDTERYISEIKSRPCLWDGFSPDYSDRDLKKKCWEELVELFGGEGQTDAEKTCLGLVLHKRWKNIRSCYTREVKRQKQIASGAVPTNRKSEYIYFKQLHFLQNVVNMRDEGEEESWEGNEEVEQPKKKSKWQTTDIDTLVQSYSSDTDELDEDKLFLLSLLSTLKGLPLQTKMETKIKMLTLLHEATDYSSDGCRVDPLVVLSGQRNDQTGSSLLASPSSWNSSKHFLDIVVKQEVD